MKQILYCGLFEALSLCGSNASSFSYFFTLGLVGNESRFNVSWINHQQVDFFGRMAMAFMSKVTWRQPQSVFGSIAYESASTCLWKWWEHLGQRSHEDNLWKRSAQDCRKPCAAIWASLLAGWRILQDLAKAWGRSRHGMQLESASAFECALLCLQFLFSLYISFFWESIYISWLLCMACVPLFVMNKKEENSTGIWQRCMHQELVQVSRCWERIGQLQRV